MRRVLGLIIAPLLGACAVGAEPPADRFTAIGPVEMVGDWADGTNISAAVVLGDRVVIGSDEIPSLQLGSWLVSGNRIRVTKTGEVPIADPGTEPDVEALAVAGDHLYAAGSHSSTRARADSAERRYVTNRERLLERDIEPHPERDAVYQLRLAGGQPSATGITRATLRDAIQAMPALRPFVALASKENGLDIEGLAPGGRGLLFGLRGPVLRHGFAAVLSASFEDLGHGELLMVPLDGRGVRDLVRVADGYLILAGPVGDGDDSHRIYAWNGVDCVPGAGRPPARLSLLGDVPAAPGGKAEALVVVGESDTSFDVVIFYDSLPLGGPRRFRVTRASPLASPATRLCGG
ncbi:MAG: DUF3616 domain-containing protein [Vicinamibacterales bacterium]